MHTKNNNYKVACTVYCTTCELVLRSAPHFSTFNLPYDHLLVRYTFATKKIIRGGRKNGRGRGAFAIQYTYNSKNN